LIDTVMTTYALSSKCVPGIANLQNIASGCKGLSVSAEHQPLKRGPYALTINRGFASMNACLVIKACD